MKKAEVQLPDGLYSQIETLAKRLHVTVADLLRRAAEQMITRPAETPPSQRDWRFQKDSIWELFALPSRTGVWRPTKRPIETR